MDFKIFFCGFPCLFIYLFILSRATVVPCLRKECRSICVRTGVMNGKFCQSPHAFLNFPPCVVPFRWTDSKLGRFRNVWDWKSVPFQAPVIRTKFCVMSAVFGREIIQSLCVLSVEWIFQSNTQTEKVKVRVIWPCNEGKGICLRRGRVASRLRGIEHSVLQLRWSHEMQFAKQIGVAKASQWVDAIFGAVHFFAAEAEKHFWSQTTLNCEAYIVGCFFQWPVLV